MASQFLEILRNCSPFLACVVRGYRLYRLGTNVCACGYDLQGNVSGVCPECGQDLRDDASATPNAAHYLAVYGTLQPGKPNHHIVADIPGTWSDGVVYGSYCETGWGAALGYPAMKPDPGGSPIAVKLLHSTELPQHWNRLDEFEGEGYRRIIIPVECGDGRTVSANIYTAL